MYRHIYRYRDNHTYTAERQTVEQADRQIDKHTNIQTEREADR